MFVRFFSLKLTGTNIPILKAHFICKYGATSESKIFVSSFSLFLWLVSLARFLNLFEANIFYAYLFPTLLVSE